MSDTKKCTKCGEEKPATLEFFARDKKGKRGIRSQCKDCDKLYREKNKEKIKEGKKLYRENNKEKVKEREKLRYENNKEKILECHKLYRENNPEKIKEISKLYYENNKEEIKEREKLRYENNKEKIKEEKRLQYVNKKQNNPYGIYKITHKETGKIYIGETIDLDRRIKEHKKRLENQSHGNHLLQEAFDNGGQDFDEIFEFEILEEWDIERKQEFDSEKKTECPKYKLLKQELRKREAEVIKEYIQQGHDLSNWGIDAKTHSSIVAEKDAIIAKMREYLEARDEQGEEEEEDETQANIHF